MTIREFIKENKTKYTVIDVDIKNVNYDTANGFTSDSTIEENENIMNIDITETSCIDMNVSEYMSYIFGNENLEDHYGYNKEDKFCVIRM